MNISAYQQNAINEAHRQYLKLDKEILDQANDQANQALTAQFGIASRLEQRTLQIILFASALIAFSGTFVLQALDEQHTNMGLLGSSLVVVIISFVSIISLFWTMRPSVSLGIPGSSPSTIDFSAYENADADSNYKHYMATILAVSKIQLDENRTNFLRKTKQIFFCALCITISPFLGGAFYLIAPTTQPTENTVHTKQASNPDAYTCMLTKSIHNEVETWSCIINDRTH